MHIGRTIQARREELGLTRRDIAALLRLSEDYYKKIELGIKEPSINLKAEIAAILNIPLSDMA